MFNKYLPFQKNEELKDGTIKVYGYASTEAVDSDGEIIKASAIEKAIDGYMKWGAVREMHEPKAAGTALDIKVLEDGKTYFSAHIVDSEAVKKVKAGVYKGFSIGGSVLKRNELNKNQIDEIDLIEVSLVDRPANPLAILEMYKKQKENKMEKEELKKNEELKKGMWTVNYFNEIFGSLVDLKNCITNEEQYEKEITNIPDDLKNIVNELGQLLMQYSNKQIEEQLTEPVMETPETPTETPALETEAEKAAKTDLNKAAKTEEFNVLEAIKDLLNKAQKPVEINAKTEEIDTLNKAFNETKDNLNKALKEIDLLKNEVEEFRKLPKPAKGVLKTLSKFEDNNNEVDNQNESNYNVVINGKVDEFATAIKKAQLKNKI